MDEHLFHKSMRMVAEVMQQVKPEHIAQSTPCIKWDVRALANHMINEVAWVKPLLEGKTIAEVGSALDGDLVGDDAAGAWHKYMEESIQAVDTTPGENMAHLSYGDKSVAAYVDEVGADIIVHGWDLAQAVGAPYTIDDQMAAAVLAATKDIMPLAKEYGMVKETLQTAEDASAEEKLLAAFGRSSHWKL